MKQDYEQFRQHQFQTDRKSGSPYNYQMKKYHEEINRKNFPIYKYKRISPESHQFSNGGYKSLSRNQNINTVKLKDNISRNNQK